MSSEMRLVVFPVTDSIQISGIRDVTAVRPSVMMPTASMTALTISRTGLNAMGLVTTVCFVVDDPELADHC